MRTLKHPLQAVSDAWCGWTTNPRHTALAIAICTNVISALVDITFWCWIRFSMPVPFASEAPEQSLQLLYSTAYWLVPLISMSWLIHRCDIGMLQKRAAWNALLIAGSVLTLRVVTVAIYRLVASLARAIVALFLGGQLSSLGASEAVEAGTPSQWPRLARYAILLAMYHWVFYYGCAYLTVKLRKPNSSMEARGHCERGTNQG